MHLPSICLRTLTTTVDNNRYLHVEFNNGWYFILYNNLKLSMPGADVDLSDNATKIYLPELYLTHSE